MVVASRYLGRFDAVTASVPADPTFVHVLRTVAAAVAGRTPLLLDDVEDLRLAVDEACAQLLALGSGAELRLVIHGEDDALRFAVSADAQAEPWPPEGLTDALSWKILSVLADGVWFERSDGRPSIEFVKLVLGPGERR